MERDRNTLWLVELKLLKVIMFTKYEYTGQENLEAMEEAKNYNNSLTKLVLNGMPRNKNNLRILDFGAGIGTYSDLIAKAGYKVECLEIDDSQVKILKSKGYKTFKDIKDIKQKYDIIYAFNVFEHIPKDSEVLSNLSKILAPKGFIIIYVPAFKCLYSKMDDLVGHCRRYRLVSLKQLSNMSGLQVVTLRYCDPLGFFITLLYKFVGNKSGTITSNNVKFYDKLVFPLSRLLEPVLGRFFGENALLIASKMSQNA